MRMKKTKATKKETEMAKRLVVSRWGCKPFECGELAPCALLCKKLTCGGLTDKVRPESNKWCPTQIICEGVTCTDATCSKLKIVEPKPEPKPKPKK